MTPYKVSCEMNCNFELILCMKDIIEKCHATDGCSNELVKLDNFIIYETI